MNFPRRQFLGMAASTTALLISNPQLGIANNSTNSIPIKPKRLKPGDRVGLISPAGATFIKENINIVIDVVKALGLVPYLAPHLLDVYGYLGGKDIDRAKDINQFFVDPRIAMLFPITGGWGCSRVLPYLD